MAKFAVRLNLKSNRWEALAKAGKAGLGPYYLEGPGRTCCIKEPYLFDTYEAAKFEAERLPDREVVSVRWEVRCSEDCDRAETLEDAQVLRRINDEDNEGTCNPHKIVRIVKRVKK